MSAPTLRNARGVYEWRGARYPSVSTILATLAKPALVPWASKLAATAAADAFDRGDIPGDRREAWIKDIAGASRRASQAAADRGSRVHAIAECLLRGQAVADAALPDDMRPYIVGLRAFVEERDPAVLHSEATVIAPDAGYAGTLDMIVQFAALPSHLYVADFKTCESADKAIVYPEARMQVAAYRRAARIVAIDGTDAPMPETAGGCIVHLWPGGFRCTDLGPDDDDYRAFVALRAVWDWKRTVDAARE